MRCTGKERIARQRREQLELATMFCKHGFKAGACLAPACQHYAPSPRAQSSVRLPRAKRYGASR